MCVEIDDTNLNRSGIENEPEGFCGVGTEGFSSLSTSMIMIRLIEVRSPNHKFARAPRIVNASIFGRLLFFLSSRWRTQVVLSAKGKRCMVLLFDIYNYTVTNPYGITLRWEVVGILQPTGVDELEPRITAQLGFSSVTGVQGKSLEMWMGERSKGELPFG